MKNMIALTTVLILCIQVSMAADKSKSRPKRDLRNRYLYSEYIRDNGFPKGPSYSNFDQDFRFQDRIPFGAYDEPRFVNNKPRFSNNEPHYGNLQRIRLVDRLKEDVRYLGNDESVEKRQGRWDVDYGLGSGRFGKRGSEDDYDLDFIL